MLKRSFAVLLILTLLIATLFGCSTPTETQPQEEIEQPQEEIAQETPEEEKEMVLYWNLGADSRTFDPQLNSAVDGGHVINNTFEGLMREVDGKLEPAMAERYEISEDKLTYTFYLRDAKWSNGEPVTAHDFEYSWKRALDPEVASEYAFQLFYVKGGQEYFNGEGSRDDVAVTALDDKTLEVTLIAPTAYFLDLVAFYTYMPVKEEVVDNDGIWAKDPSKFICNGPFKLTKYSAGDRLILEPNENYWNADIVKLDRIEVTMIVDESTELTAYEAGDLDIIDTMPVQEIPRLLAEDPTFQILPDLAAYYYIFNVDQEPVNDPLVRRALALAIDRKAVVEQVTKAGQMPATGIVPNGLKLSTNEEFRKAAGDYGIDPNASKVEEARELLTEAGYPNGEGFPAIELLYNTGEAHKAVAEAIQEMRKQNLGIEVILSNQEWAVFQDSRHQGSFTVARGGWGADYADPMTFLDLWTSYSGNNDTQWKNTEYDKLIEKAKVTSGKERDDLLLATEKMMMDEMITMPVYYYTDPVMVKETVKDWQKTILGHWYFAKAYIE